MTSPHRKITIPGAVGLLEAIVENPFVSPKKLLGIVCHPHPLYEGTMYNKVVTTVVRAFQRLEIVPLRFNFRGVGKSEGEYGNVVGELDDLRAVINWAKEHFPEYKLILAGFSFGSYIATKVATEVKPVALITIAPPVHHNDFAALPPIDFPWAVVQGAADEVVPSEQVFSWVAGLAKKPVLFSMPGVGHFFHGQLIELRDGLINWLKPIAR